MKPSSFLRESLFSIMQISLLLPDLDSRLPSHSINGNFWMTVTSGFEPTASLLAGQSGVALEIYQNNFPLYSPSSVDLPSPFRVKIEVSWILLLEFVKFLNLAIHYEML